MHADERADYELVAERTERVHGGGGQAADYFGALLNSPPLAAVLTRLGTAVRQGEARGTYSDSARELLDVSLAAWLGQNAILPIHIPDALAVGVRPEAVEALLAGRDDDLTEDERQLVLDFPQPGILFEGALGTGKTLVSRYVAAKSDALFVNVRDFPLEGAGLHQSEAARNLDGPARSYPSLTRRQRPSLERGQSTR